MDAAKATKTNAAYGMGNFIIKIYVENFMDLFLMSYN